MNKRFDSRYYKLDKIAAYRLDYIKLRVKWFIDIYNIKQNEWPLDCTQLIKKMKTSQIIPFEYGFFLLPDHCEAITDYHSGHHVYLMQVNRNKAKYPFVSSADRRLNFTLAHEIGHIILDHLKIPRELKTKDELELEENEANEFAGRLLLPEFLLLTCNYYSLDLAAQYFIVSKTALWMRLNNLKRLDLLSSRRIRSCHNCGNISFSVFAEFCGICGKPVHDGLKGMRRIVYPEEIKMDRYKRVLSCPACHSDKSAAHGDRCGICKTYIFNFCTSYLDEDRDECSYANSGNSRFCEICGRPTYYYQKKLLRPWREAFECSCVSDAEAIYV